MEEQTGATHASEQRRSPWPWIGGLVGLAIALVIAVVVVTSGGDKPSSEGTGPTVVAGVEETKALLDGIPQAGFALGDPKAPVTLLEYVDLQCPFCKLHQLDAQPTLIKELVRTGQAQISFVPLAFLGQQSVEARNVFLRFVLRNQGWEFANLFYWNQGDENSGYVTPESSGSSSQTSTAARPQTHRRRLTPEALRSRKRQTRSGGPS